MASREPYDAAVERGDGDAEAGADAPQCAARQKYVAAWLKGCATGSWDESKKMYDSALWDAPDLVFNARHGDLNGFRRLLEAEPASAHQADEVMGFTAMMAALCCEDMVVDRTEMVRLLLAAPDIDVNRTNAIGGTALMQACVTSNVEGAKLLLAVPEIDVNIADKNGATALAYAANAGSYSVVKLMLAAPNIDIYARDGDGCTARKVAARAGHKFVVRAIDTFASARAAASFASARPPPAPAVASPLKEVEADQVAEELVMKLEDEEKAAASKAAAPKRSRKKKGKKPPPKPSAFVLKYEADHEQLRRDEEQRLRKEQDDAMARAREAVIARKEAERAAEEQWRRDQEEAQAAEAPPVAEITQVVAPAPNEIAPQRLPPEIVCPITDEIMRDPVMAADGHTYERRAITDWFAHHDTSPITNLALDNTNLIPNHLARSLAQRFRDECRAEGVDPDSLN